MNQFFITPKRRMGGFGADFLRVAVLWAGLGIIAFFSGPRLVAISASRNSSEVVARELREFDFAEVQGFVAQGGVLLDARPKDQYEAGHLPGALSLARRDFDRETLLISRLPRTELVVVYCAGVECEDAEVVARKLQTVGFERVGLYRGGWEEWQENAAGRP